MTQHVFFLRFILPTAVALALSLPTTAKAACASPTANAGSMNWSGSEMQVCDGTSWSGLGSSQWVDGTAGAISYSGGNVGIGSASPGTTLDVNGNINATSFNSQLLSNGSQSGALVVGQSATASGTNATAIGNTAAAGTGAVAIGSYASAPASTAIAIGASSSTTSSGVAVGGSASSTAYGVAIGSSTKAGAHAVAVGAFADAQTSVSTTCVALGRGATCTGNGQIVVGSSGLGLTSTYLGSGVTATAPDSHTINVTGGSGTDIAGGNLTLAAGRGTGAGAGGYIAFQTAAAGATGTTLRSLSERLRIDTSGNVGIGTTTPGSALDVIGAGVFSSTVTGATPTADGHLATKGYVDAAVAGAGSAGPLKLYSSNDTLLGYFAYYDHNYKSFYYPISSGTKTSVYASRVPNDVNGNCSPLSFR